MVNSFKGLRKNHAYDILIIAESFLLYAGDSFRDNNIFCAVIVVSCNHCSVFIIPQATASLNGCDIFEVLESFILHVIR